MTVTALEPYSKGRVAIYIDNSFAFVLYKGELSNYGIDEGVEIDSVKYDSIMNEVLIPRAKKRGMNLLMTMDRTERDVRNKLSDGGYPDEAVDASIEYLKSFHYIDDSRYAQEYIRCKQNSISRRNIIIKLTQKGISQDIIEECYRIVEEDNNSYNTEDESISSPESALVKRLIIKRTKGNTELTYEDRRKLYGYLYNKGFSIEQVDVALRELASEGASEN